MDSKLSKKLYNSGYWQAARQLPAHQFGPGSTVAERYTQGYKAGQIGISTGRAQYAMVWSSERRPIANPRSMVSRRAAKRAAAAAAA